MSDLQEPNPNISALASLYPEGKYPSHIDVFGKGGFVALNDEIGLSGYDEFINERIRFLRRKSGMLVYISSDETYHRCLTAGSDETDGQWKREYFTGRYFHGPSAPTADDLQMGERWFDTVVGTEYTYIPIAEGSTYLEWVDMDHLGTGRKYFYGLTAPEAGTDGDPLNIGDKWFNSTVGSEFTYLPTDGTLTGNKQWIDIDSPGSKGEEVLDIWVNESGDTMTGTLTGPHLNFDTGFVGTLTGTDASFDSITASNGFIGTLTGNTSFMNSSMIVSNSLAFENQPVAKIQKIGGTTIPYAGYTAGTDGFMNLPRLVLEHKATNSWGWPNAIDFKSRPIVGSDTSVITHRIGTLFSTGSVGESQPSPPSPPFSRLIFWGAPAQNSLFGGGATGISAVGMSGEGLVTLGYFQHAVGLTSSGFHVMKGFRTSDDEEFQDNEFVTRDSTLPQLTSTSENTPLGTVVPIYFIVIGNEDGSTVSHSIPLPGPGKWFVHFNGNENSETDGGKDEDTVFTMSKVWSVSSGKYLKFKLIPDVQTTQVTSFYYAISDNPTQPSAGNQGNDNYTRFTNNNAFYVSLNSPDYNEIFGTSGGGKNGVMYTDCNSPLSRAFGYAIKISDTP